MFWMLEELAESGDVDCREWERVGGGAEILGLSVNVGGDSI